MGYQLVAGDAGSKLRTTCKDTAGQLIDLTGKTVKLRYKIDSGALQTKNMTVPQPATDGVAEYQFGAVDVTPGQFVGEVRINDGLSDQITSVDVIVLPVRAPLS